MNLLRAFSIIFILLIACSPQQKEKEEELKLAQEGAIYRGVQMGNSPADVSSSELADPVVLSDTLMHFKEKMAFNDTLVDLHVYYAFDEYGLFEIQSDYMSSGPLQDSLFYTLKGKLTATYGQPSNHFELHRWTTTSRSNDLIEISLSKEVDLEGKSFVSLNYLEPLNEQL